MKVNIMPAVSATAGSQASMDIAQDGNFAAALEQKTQQLDPLIQEGAGQSAPLPVGEDPVNVNHELPGDIFDPIGNLPGNRLNEKQKETVGDQAAVLASVPVDSQIAHLQTLVMKMDEAVNANAGQRGEVAAAAIDAEEGDATLANIAQAVLTVRTGSVEGSSAAPTAAALVKQGYGATLQARKEASQETQVAPVLPETNQVEQPEQTASLFKPVIEGAAAVLSADGQPSFTPVASAHAPSVSSLLTTHSVSVPATAVPAPVLTPEVGTIAWQQSLGQQVALFTRNGIHNAEIRLNPAELGDIKINLRMNSDQASLHFVSENHQVRAALEAAMPQLRSSLAESGIHLETSRVDSGFAQSWSGSSHSEWESAQAAHEDNNRDVSQQDDEEALIRTPHLRHNSGINTFV
ncbi:MAG TPA: flagellar hook-length control protein FliK [Buttiauxella sp.]|jgi:flagellar hook-length control protein FliK